MLQDVEDPVGGTFLIFFFSEHVLGRRARAALCRHRQRAGDGGAVVPRAAPLEEHLQPLVRLHERAD